MVVKCTLSRIIWSKGEGKGEVEGYLNLRLMFMIFKVNPGAIIRDGDHNEMPF